MAKSVPPAARGGPRVGLLYSAESPWTREGEYVAKYMGLCMASVGFAGPVVVVGVPSHSNPAPKSNDSSAASSDSNATKDSAAIRADGIVVKASTLGPQRYRETRDLGALVDCAVWVLCLDTHATMATITMLQKRIPVDSAKTDRKDRQKRVIVCLQPALRQLREVESAFPKAIVLHGGACFHMTVNKHEILYPLSHGCYYIERLSAEKTQALFAIDLLESTGFQVLSRKGIQAMKWGHSLVRLFYYLNALTGQRVEESLRDRAIRLVYLEMLREITELFTTVTSSWELQEAEATIPTNTRNEGSSNGQSGQPASRKKVAWVPDASACTYLSIHALMVLLPLPNWLFNGLVVRLVDFGLSASASGYSTILRDVEANRETEFWIEFKDVFDLAGRRDIPLPALTELKNILATTQDAKNGCPRIAGHVLLTTIPVTPASRAVSRGFFVKLILTIVATLLLLSYFLL